jgi:hypothetical protein
MLFGQLILQQLVVAVSRTFIFLCWPGLTATVSAKSIFDAFQLFISREISHVVLQTNRKAGRQIREWNDCYPSELRQEWSTITGDEIMAYFKCSVTAQLMFYASFYNTNLA